MRIVVACLLAIVVAAGAPAARTALGAAALPAQLTARLDADRERAQRQLDERREALAKAARAQRRAAANAARTADRAQVLADVADLTGARLPAAIDEAADEAVTGARARLDGADASLEQATRAAAGAQGAVLDAERRILAIRQAQRTGDRPDAAVGSWRFGSGGPAVSAASIDRYLESKGSPLAGQGEAFLVAGVRERVDPRLVVAIAGAESYFGITTCAPHNAWGWGCPSSPFAFDAWRDAIDTVTHGLRTNYLDDGLTSVGEIHLRYAPPAAANDPDGLNYAWADNVARFLVEQGGDPQDVDGIVASSR